MNNVFFENLALTNNGEKVYAIPGVEASVAPYYTKGQSDYYSIINLRNTNKGYTYALSALLENISTLVWTCLHLTPLDMQNQ